MAPTRKINKRRKLFEKQNGLCAYCDLPLVSYESFSAVMDHIIPRSKGGTDGIKNRALVCNTCDGLKENFLNLEDFLARNQRALEKMDLQKKLFMRLREKGIS